MDWAGILVERVSGMRLDEYFQKNIFGPAEIADVSMCPSVEQVERMSPLHRRDRHNNLKAGKQALSHLFAMSEPQCLGGTGTFGPPSQYVKLLGVLLNDGMCEMTATKILSPESVAQMFVNQIPQFPNFAARGIRGGDPAVLHEVEEITIPGQKSNSKGFGFAGMLQEIETPARQVAWWCGLSNVYWWCDWDTGVAAIVGAQIMPFWGLSSFLASFC
jgi:CubicO group peptidase (beta-lactamase class C family)